MLFLAFSSRSTIGSGSFERSDASFEDFTVCLNLRLDKNSCLTKASRYFREFIVLHYWFGLPYKDVFTLTLELVFAPQLMKLLFDTPFLDQSSFWI